jgi:VanZ family protein
MRILFSILSIFYISGIFLLAGSPFISKIATFNPYSLLHIPLYGVLTVLLIFSIIPFKNSPNNQRNQIDQIDQTNRFLFAGLIALGVAVADEVHQTSIPGRDGSIADVLLDAIGIALVLLLIHRIFRWKISSSTRPT